jgi:subtilase family serine protease
MKGAVNPGTSSRAGTALFCLLILSLIACLSLPAFAGSFVAHNTPSYVKTAKNLGPEDPAKTIEVSIWLKPHNRSQLDSLARDLYDRNSPSYRHFLNRAQIAKMFAPTAAEAAKVQEFLEAQGLKVVKVGPDNFFVRASGTVRDVQNAFHVQLNNYQIRGKVVRANASDPYIDSDVADLAFSVSGLDSGEYTHPAMQRSLTPPSTTNGFATAQARANAAQASASASSLYSSVCFNGTEKEVLTTGNVGALPIGTYVGNHLNYATTTSSGCGYTPPVVQTAYNLKGLYAEGYNGAGQTIAILDWCGSPTITQDANAFSKEFGLPALTPSNFQIIYTPTVSACEGPNPEINIDVEWSHAVAPGANINLIVPPTASFQDVNEAEYTTVNYGLGTVISGSYGSAESETPASEIANEDLISEIAAASGISTNFSTGDDGDFTDFGIPATVSAPADSPWATAVGGVTVAMNSSNQILWQAGWGNNETLLAEEGTIFDPPIPFGFYGGAGGGPTNCVTQSSNLSCLGGFPKPAFQKGLPGSVRLLPDVAWIADPFTGVAILITEPDQIPSQVWLVYGGTSVAAPMFSGLWAIANQEAGAPLGDAAPYLYSMPAGTITDIVPVTSTTNVIASVKESSTVTHSYNSNAVMGGASPGLFVSAILDYPFAEFTPYAFSFGTDCATVPEGPLTLCTSPKSLHTTKGWDNVTGVGVPNPKAFADFFHP